MLRPLALLALASTFALMSCGKAAPDHSSVRMKLPAARPAEARPGFSAIVNEGAAVERTTTSPPTRAGG